MKKQSLLLVVVRADLAIFKPTPQQISLLRISPLAKINLIPGKCLTPVSMVYFRCPFPIIVFRGLLPWTGIISSITSGNEQDMVTQWCLVICICQKLFVKHRIKNKKKKKSNEAYVANPLFFPHFLPRKRERSIFSYNLNNLASEKATA